GGVALYPSPTGNRAIFTHTDGASWLIDEWDLDPAHAPMPAIVPPPFAALGEIGLDPTGNVVWYLQGTGVVWATRANDWADTGHADLGFPQSIVKPGSVGFYDGTARMAVVVETSTSAPRLVELSSPDGLRWDPLPTIQFTLPGSPAAPSLSTDACLLLVADAS